MTLLLLSALAWAGAADIERLLAANRVGEALDEARSSVQAAPSDVESHELLIDILMNVGLGQSAEDAYRRFVADNPNSAMAWYLLGRAAVSVPLARTSYERSLKLDPSYARSTMGLASIERAVGDAGKAELLYRDAVRKDPTLAEAWSGLGALLIGQGREAEAVEICKLAVRAVPADPEAWLALAALESDKSRAWLEAGTKAAPQEPRLWEALAQAALDDGDVKAARKALEAALRLYPGSPEAVLQLQVVQEMEAGRLDRQGQLRLSRARALSAESPVAAEVEFADLVRDYPKCFLVYLARGHLYANQDMLPQAEADLRMALQLAPLSADCAGALGLLLLHEGKAKDAHPLLKQAWEARPYDVKLGVSYGMTIAATQGVKAGVEFLSRLSDQNPTETAPVMAIVSLLSQTNQPQAANEVLVRAVARHPHPSLLLALAASQKDLGQKKEAAATLHELARVTGEAKYDRMAQDLEAQL